MNKNRRKIPPKKFVRQNFGYVVIENKIITDGTICLRAVDLKDIEMIRIWRNAQMGILRQKQKITRNMQRQYFETEVWPEKNNSQPRQVLLAIDRLGILIGYGGLVHISWLDRRAEVSFLLNPLIANDEKLYSQIFVSCLEFLKKIAFNQLKIHKIWTETYNIRSYHIAALEAAGFEREGVLRDHNWIDGQPVDSVFHASINNI